MGFTEFLTIIFIIFKLFKIINWSWWLVVLPEIIMLSIYAIALLLQIYLRYKLKKQFKFFNKGDNKK